MSIQTKTHTESLKSRYEEAVSQRIILLKERGLELADLRKDSRLKFLKAKSKQMQRRLSALARIERQYEAVARRKREMPLEKPEKKAPPKKKPRPVVDQGNS